MLTVRKLLFDHFLTLDGLQVLELMTKYDENSHPCQ